MCAYMWRFRRYAACGAVLLTAVREFRAASGDNRLFGYQCFDLQIEPPASALRFTVRSSKT
jgi:hypothetical protein